MTVIGPPASGLFSLCTLPPDQSCWKIELIGSLPIQNLHWAPIALTEWSWSVSPSQCSSQPHGHLQATHSRQRVVVDHRVKGLVPSPWAFAQTPPFTFVHSSLTGHSLLVLSLGAVSSWILYLLCTFLPTPIPTPAPMKINLSLFPSSEVH